MVRRRSPDKHVHTIHVYCIITVLLYTLLYAVSESVFTVKSDIYYNSGYYTLLREYLPNLTVRVSQNGLIHNIFFNDYFIINKYKAFY